MNTLDANIQNEKQLIELLNKKIEKYNDVYKIINAEIKALDDRQKKFPEKYMARANEGNYEDLLILASQLKHRAIVVTRNVTGALVELDAELDYFESQILLYFAEYFLKEKGFDKITDLLRNSYLKSNKELKKLKVLKGKIKAVEESTEALIKAFESDEVNFRKFLDMKNKLRGLQ